MTTPTHQYLVTLARDHTLKLHRSTCKKALANPAATPTDNFHTELGGKKATPATCCKPRFVLIPETLPEPKAKREAVAVLVRFHRGKDVENLRPMTDSQNKVASLAYYHTAGINGDEPRIPTEQLRQILHDAGVANIEGEPWGPVTLPNGVVLQATALA